MSVTRTKPQRAFFVAVWLLLGAMFLPLAGAEETAFQRLDRQTETLLGEVLDLGAALEEARQPVVQNQLLVLLSLLPAETFQLAAVEVKIDGEVVALHDYSAAELDALGRGGSHRLFLAALPAGEHELAASWLGKAPKAKELVRGLKWAFRAGEGRRMVELRLAQDKERALPIFSLKEW